MVRKKSRQSGRLQAISPVPSEREFRRFRRRGIPSLAVQGLRQKGFRGRSDSKSGTTPEEKSLGQIETFPL